ncbi:MAG TPA: alpha-L-fucosidase [Gemmatimonadaceae bacterium]
MNRRSFLQFSASALAGCARLPGTVAGLAPARPAPSAAQLAWQRDELALFLHFGVNTFTDKEWGEGWERPALFLPTSLDARQWSRTAKAAGARALILTAKHHDGFCLWPTSTTKHSVASSDWRGGTGDVVREFTDACRADGLKAGLYLSPWDRNSPTYGDSPRYNNLYSDQLTELLTRYGPISEVWFDGANGEGPNGKTQFYDWPRFFGIVRQFQPEAVIFSDAGPDVRWCGNEKGIAGDPNWSTVDPARVKFPGDEGVWITEALQHGDRDGTVWRPAEVDVSIRPGWFYHSAEDNRVRSAENLMELYFSSVGRNGKLLLNVPPTTGGLLHPIDVSVLTDFRSRLKTVFDNDLAANAAKHPFSSGGGWGVELELPQPAAISIARLEEDITRGQSVAKYVLHGAAETDWQVLSRGSTIGYTKLDRFPPTTVRRVRLTVQDAATPPIPVTIRLYN